MSIKRFTLFYYLKSFFKERYERNEKDKIAKSFNDRYVNRRPYTNKVIGVDLLNKPIKQRAWMCHKCNTIHLATGFSVFSGTEFKDVMCCRSHVNICLYKSVLDYPGCYNEDSN